MNRLPKKNDPGDRSNQPPPPPVAAMPGGQFAEFHETKLEANARALLHRLGYERLAARVTVRWNPRLRTTAGLAHPAKALVSLNPRLIPFGMEEVDRTLRHELAHLLARFRAGRRRIDPHGAEWRQACADLGLAGETRCHDLPLPRVRMARRFLYHCRNCRSEVRRVRPFKRAVACLTCCRMFNHGRYHDRYRLLLTEEQESPQGVLFSDTDV